MAAISQAGHHTEDMSTFRRLQAASTGAQPVHPLPSHLRKLTHKTTHSRKKGTPCGFSPLQNTMFARTATTMQPNSSSPHHLDGSTSTAPITRTKTQLHPFSAREEWELRASNRRFTHTSITNHWSLRQTIMSSTKKQNSQNAMHTDGRIPRIGRCPPY